MAVFAVPNVEIVGVGACVPSYIDRNADLPLLSEEEKDKLISSIGVEEKRIADDSVCTSDLCYQAAEKLIEDLKWDKKDIECLIFVSQTPDYILPATSCILQNKLSLSQECHTIDISLGCSGWVYGLSMISSLMSAGQIKKGLLLVGDTTSKTTSPKDKSSWPLFGDAGTATGIIFNEGAKGFLFHTATDGGGSDAIKIPDGGYRNPFNNGSLIMHETGEGGQKNNLHCILEGMDVFSFAISKVPKSVKKVLEAANVGKDNIDYYLFHQANLFLNETIRKKMKLSLEQVPYSINKFGNTSCATIPLTMVANLKNELESHKLRLIGSGFGVGLSWATVYFETDHIICSNLIEYNERL